jgi:glutathione S-transferase
VGIDLYVVPGSHPCAAVERALQLKRLGYRRIELPPPVHAPVAKLRFGARTVPAIVLADGERLSGSSAIMRRLDDLVAEPALFPSDPEARALVERAEEWGDEVFQPIARRLLWATVRRRPDALASYAEGSRLPLPALAIRALAPAVARVGSAMHDAGDGAVRADLRSLPRHLDRVDGWIARGVLGAEPPNAADLQIGATSRLLLTMGDVAPFLAGRPAERHTRAVYAPQAGSTPRGVLPEDWLAGSPPRRSPAGSRPG